MSASNVKAGVAVRIDVGKRNIKRSSLEKEESPMVNTLWEGSFFGQRLGCRAVHGITLTESMYRSEVVIPPHEHATAFFDFVVGGFCSESIQKKTRNRARSTLAFHPAGEVHHSCWHGHDARCFHIE